MSVLVRSSFAIVVLILVQLTSTLPIASQASNSVNPPLKRLATATQIDASQLVLSDSASFTLSDGTELTRVKAINRTTGEIVGGTLQGDKLVDETALRAKAGQAWRAKHGAITPELLKILEPMQATDKLMVSVWLVADVQALPVPEDTHVAQDGGSAGSADAPAPDAAPRASADSKAFAPNTPDDQVPADVRQPITLSDTGASNAAEAVILKGTASNNMPDNTAALAQAETYKQQNTAHLRAQVKPVVDHFAALMQARGIQVLAGDSIAPTAMLEVTRAQAEEVAMLAEIDTMYAIPPNAGPDMGVARPTQNANLLETLAGYTGAGVKAAVAEGERAFNGHPYYTLAGIYDAAKPFADHPTAVSGMIRSTHPTVRGIAPGVSLYSANGSYSDWNVMKLALAYATTNAKVINNSWYWDASNSAVFWEADRILDYYVRYNRDFVAVAAGNFGNGCGGNFSSYVTSPAKGYNVMSVGNYDDHDTLGWSDDSMDTCSSFGDPSADAASPTHAKPEVAAVGHGISSTTTSAPWFGPVGSGTSYASPMIVGLAANMIQASASIGNYPEAIKAVIMATALHNIEGSSDYSDKDGAGGMDATAALASVERGNWAGRTVQSSDAYPIVYSQYAYKGERVRFVITWGSNPNAAFTNDVLPADLDLTAYRADGTTTVDSSASGSNNFEIVDFIAPATETYQFKVTKWTFSGSATYMGVGWWRGTYRIAPDTGYGDPKATPLGTHLSVYPTDWSPSNYWRVMGIRPTSADHDLMLYTRSIFDDPALRSVKSSSAYGGTGVDLIAVDGNSWPSGNQEQYRVSLFSGATGGYDLSWSNLGLGLSRGRYGPYSMTANEVAKVFDVYIPAYSSRRIYIEPSGNSNDLVALLFKSDWSNSNTWAQPRSAAYLTSDRGTATGTVEYFDAVNSTSSSDWYGLVVYGKNHTTSKFYIYIPYQVYAPLVRKP